VLRNSRCLTSNGETAPNGDRFGPLYVSVCNKDRTRYKRNRCIPAIAAAKFFRVFCSVAMAISGLGVAALGFCACLHPDKRVTPESKGMQNRRPISDVLVFVFARSMLVTRPPSMRNHMLLRRLFELLSKLP
jgi:hypothetical protein